MNAFGISDKSYQLILTALEKYPQVEEAIVFGSRAKGKYKKGSDIDLAIKGDQCNERVAANVNAYLNEELPVPYHVDIVYYDGLEHAELKEHIDRIGKIFYQSNKKYVLNEPSAEYKEKSEEQ